jgi:hypothetical protein
VARPINEIYSDIIAYANSDPKLTELTSTSQLALYKLIAFCVATSLNYHEQLIDELVTEIETHISPINTEKWFYDQSLKFQYGDVIQIGNDFLPYYPVIDPTKQIIKRCTAKETTDDIVELKVATYDSSNNLIALDTDQINAYESYINTIKPAGTPVRIISLNKDRLMVNANIYYDPQYTLSVVQENVKNTINNYLATLPFNGVVSLSQLEIQLITNTEGVLDLVFNEVKGRTAGISITSAIPFNRFYETSAGYIISEDTPSYTLDDTITYIVFTN